MNPESLIEKIEHVLFKFKYLYTGIGAEIPFGATREEFNKAISEISLKGFSEYVIHIHATNPDTFCHHLIRFIVGPDVVFSDIFEKINKSLAFASDRKVYDFLNEY